MLFAEYSITVSYFKLVSTNTVYIFNLKYLNKLSLTMRKVTPDLTDNWL